MSSRSVKDCIFFHTYAYRMLKCLQKQAVCIVECKKATCKFSLHLTREPQSWTPSVFPISIPYRPAFLRTHLWSAWNKLMRSEPGCPLSSCLTAVLRGCPVRRGDRRRERCSMNWSWAGFASSIGSEETLVEKVLEGHFRNSFTSLSPPRQTPAYSPPARANSPYLLHQLWRQTSRAGGAYSQLAVNLKQIL